MNAGTCKHYTGSHHNKTCAAGVCYDDVTTDPRNPVGKALRLPCHSKPWPKATESQLAHYHNRGTCAKYEEPTRADIAISNARANAAVVRLKASFPLIDRVKKLHRGEDWKGVETCPVCSGKLHMTHAKFNGHVWGKCETDDCLSWME